MWSDGVGKNMETNKEHGEDCIEEGFQLARIKYDMDSEGGRESPDMGNCGDNI